MNLLRLPAVIKRVGLGPNKIYKMIREGRFPAPVKQGTASHWIDEEIDEYIRQLQASRTTTTSS